MVNLYEEIDPILESFANRHCLAVSKEEWGEILRLIPIGSLRNGGCAYYITVEPPSSDKKQVNALLWDNYNRVKVQHNTTDFAQLDESLSQLYIATKRLLANDHSYFQADTIIETWEQCYRGVIFEVDNKRRYLFFDKRTKEPLWIDVKPNETGTDFRVILQNLPRTKSYLNRKCNLNQLDDLLALTVYLARERAGEVDAVGEKMPWTE